MRHGTKAGAEQRWMDRGCPTVPPPVRRGSMRSVRISMPGMLAGMRGHGPVYLSRPVPKAEAKKGWGARVAGAIGRMFGRGR